MLLLACILAAVYINNINILILTDEQEYRFCVNKAEWVTGDCLVEQ